MSKPLCSYVLNDMSHGKSILADRVDVHHFFFLQLILNSVSEQLFLLSGYISPWQGLCINDPFLAHLHPFLNEAAAFHVETRIFVGKRTSARAGCIPWTMSSISRQSWMGTSVSLSNSRLAGLIAKDLSKVRLPLSKRKAWSERR